MFPGPVILPKKLGHSQGQAENQKLLHHGVKDMMSTLTHGLTNIHQMDKSGSSRWDEEDNEGGQIITIAGSNIGATMRTDLEEIPDPHLTVTADPQGLTTYANSNFQAINNSIMLGGSYTCNDPGVHIDVSDYLENYDQAQAPEKHGKREMKKDKKQPESEQQNE